MQPGSSQYEYLFHALANQSHFINTQYQWKAYQHICVACHFYREAGKNCKCLEFSPDGSRAAWYDGTALQIYDVMKDRILHTIECAPLTYLHFSPKSTILATWQVYSSGKFHSST